MSLVPTSQCITDCSILNQSTCLPATTRPRPIVNYHMVSMFYHDAAVDDVDLKYLYHGEHCETFFNTANFS